VGLDGGSGFDFQDTGAGGGQPGDMSDFTLDDGEDALDFDDSSTGGKTGDTLTDEMDDFLSDEDDLAPDLDADLEDFTFDEPENESHEQTTAEIIDEALGLFDRQSYGEAMVLYEKLLDSGKLNDNAEFGKVYYEFGRCHFKLRQPKEAMESFTNVIKKYPDSNLVKDSLYQIGELFESINQKSKAIAYFKKVSTMAPRDPLSDQALNKIKQLQG